MTRISLRGSPGNFRISDKIGADRYWENSKCSGSAKYVSSIMYFVLSFTALLFSSLCSEGKTRSVYYV